MHQEGFGSQASKAGEFSSYLARQENNLPPLVWKEREGKWGHPLVRRDHQSRGNGGKAQAEGNSPRIQEMGVSSFFAPPSPD